MIIKNKLELENLKEGGKRLHKTLRSVRDYIEIGMSTMDVEKKAREIIYEFGDTPSFLNYSPEGASRPYPSAMCVSINDELVHGIPNERDYRFKNGDIVTLDCGLTHKGLIVDSAITFSLGDISEERKNLIKVCKEALEKAIDCAKAGVKTKKIGEVIENHIKSFGYSIPLELGGHGVGERVHEEPFIPNVERMGTNEKLKENQVIAIEPIAIEGNNSDIILADDGYTYKSMNGAVGVHWEHTILIQKKHAVIIT